MEEGHMKYPWKNDSNLQCWLWETVRALGHVLTTCVKCVVYIVAVCFQTISNVNFQFWSLVVLYEFHCWFVCCVLLWEFQIQVSFVNIKDGGSMISQCMGPCDKASHFASYRISKVWTWSLNYLNVVVNGIWWCDI